jgi:hypothetical protein
MWIHGDGVTHAAITRVKKFLCTLIDNYDAHQNCLSTLEVWHTRLTILNSITKNHFGPTTSIDPASLLWSYAAAKFKRPSDTANCDWYRTERNLKIVWNAHVLDCWRHALDAKPDLLEYFCSLDLELLPMLEVLIEKGWKLVNQYASETGIQHALNLAFYRNLPEGLSVLHGSPWTPPISLKSDGAASSLVEEEGFTGDRVLANSEMFL